MSAKHPDMYGCGNGLPENALKSLGQCSLIGQPESLLILKEYLPTELNFFKTVYKYKLDRPMLVKIMDEEKEWLDENNPLYRFATHTVHEENNYSITYKLTYLKVE